MAGRAELAAARIRPAHVVSQPLRESCWCDVPVCSPSTPSPHEDDLSAWQEKGVQNKFKRDFGYPGKKSAPRRCALFAHAVQAVRCPVVISAFFTFSFVR